MNTLKLTVSTLALAAIATLSASTSALAQEQAPHHTRHSPQRSPRTVQLHSTTGCASGWVESSAPGGCSPGSFTTLDAQPVDPQPVNRGLPPGECREGFSHATHPLNPQLGCLPDNVAAPSAPEPSPASPQLRRLR
ncbi:MAG: hypothetical protein AAF268_03965 [Cyanobacteria bacterium P01_A01_bin.3]